uniref:T-cell immunomodulatory protein TIP C2 domain-containing protein n=1 Tax=Chromera velia CCMP2878 TaxID=1169474 RepID=A0A0G4IDR7_9ALVE|eukprot:Cvel_2333.t1-p1 / transcript=Cvel_2333.t1 / gene=Cvel_2333 / organism=Chromera_velia_CCMP2878 / gene_product=T-cell immunomodulatory protein homolog, putative / transcript_product=T-cell immunomodulatory protein homolog, putative / location=Cvel_scaffold90:30529-42688(-) / protein_length=811 / sequence_SO=supercontig / SO=protein_coding / is_pseudo=false
MGRPFSHRGRVTLPLTFVVLFIASPGLRHFALCDWSRPSYGIENVPGTIASFGDFNSDKFHDLLYIEHLSTGQQRRTTAAAMEKVAEREELERRELGVGGGGGWALLLYEWSNSKTQFLPWKGGNPKAVDFTAVVGSSYVPVNVASTDWNFDGQLDMVVTAVEVDKSRPAEGPVSDVEQGREDGDTGAEGTGRAFFRLWSYLLGNSQAGGGSEAGDSWEKGDGVKYRVFVFLQRVDGSGERFFVLGPSTVPVSDPGGDGTSPQGEAQQAPSVVLQVQPVIVDLDADGYPDLVADGWQETGGGGDTQERGTASRLVLLNDAGHKFDAVPWQDWLRAHSPPGSSVDAGAPPNLLAPFHASATVDINGDCRADVVLETVADLGAGTKRVLEVWLRADGKAKGAPVAYAQPDSSAVSVLEIGLSDGMPSFLDANGDGSIDVVVPACEKRADGGRGSQCVEGSAVQVYANKLKTPMCASAWATEGSGGCRPQSGLCAASEFVFEKGTSSPLEEGVQFYAQPGWPSALRAGDFDADGNVDLLSVVVSKNMGGDSSFPLVLRNSDGSFESDMMLGVSSQAVPPGGKRARGPGNEILNEARHTYTAAFFDFGEDGVLDIFRFEETSSGAPKGVAQVQNADTDVFHLKATALNGVCTQGCRGAPDPNPRPYGVGLYGATFKLTVTDLNGNKQERIVGQNPQSTYTPLSLPFAYFGLGRTNNYIENFFLGMPSTGSNRASNHWVSIIPNTQVIAIPFPLHKSSDWQLELSVSPSRYFFWILMATVVTLIALGSVIVFLDRKEKAEDLKEQQEKFRAHFISA